MIAKRVLRPGASSDFARLGAYILGESRSTKDAAPDQTFDYILADPAGGRVGTVRITNCHAATPALAIMEILATQSLNKRGRGDRTYHLVVSFEPGERPAPAQIEDIETELCAAIGLSGLQRISALHLDRAHLHLHIAINKIDPATLRCVEPYYDKRKLMKACDELEIKHGLARTNHGRSHKGGPKGRAADFEAHSGQNSFASWVMGKIEAPLLDLLAGACGWDDVHALLGKEGLALKKRGAGFVIVDAAGRGIRASAVNRAFSMKALTTQLGAFRGLARLSGAGRLSSEAASRQHKSAVRRLYAPASAGRRGSKTSARSDRARPRAHFLVFREASRPGQEIRSHAHRKARAAPRAPAASVANAGRGEEARTGGPRGHRQPLLLHLDRFPAGSRGAGRRGCASRAALERQARDARAAADFITAPDAAAAKTIILQNLRPAIGKNGDLAYRLADGGVVTDEKERIRVDRLSYQAVVTALTLGEKRFQGQTLALDGTEPFKRQAVEAAAALRLTIVFADDEMEKDRLDLIARKMARAPAQAVSDFIAEKNLIAHKRSSGYSFRLWTAGDAGEAIYRGLGTVEGHQMLLLQRGAEVLVRPASPDDADRAKAWRAGAAVQFSGSSRGKTRS